MVKIPDGFTPESWSKLTPDEKAEHHRKKHLEYRLKNKEKINKKNAEWKEKNKERSMAISRKYYYDLKKRSDAYLASTINSGQTTAPILSN